MKEQPTLRDVARLSEVSLATVSRVARDNPAVDPGIRERVKQAASTLGIELGQRRRDSARMVAFVLSNRNILHNFQARILVGAEEFCKSRNWELVFTSFQYDASVPAKDLVVPQILQRQTVVRAAILAGLNHPNLLEALRIRHIPFSVFGNNVDGDWPKDGCDVVYSDDTRGCYELTRHLIGQGHRQIWFIGNLEYPWYIRCSRGYRRAMSDHLLEPHIAELHAENQELGYLATMSIITGSHPVTAIFAGSDQVARGAYSALRQSGIHIPSGITVVGVNDTDSAFFEPPLTSVRTFPEQVGRHLADFTLARIKEPDRPPQELNIATQVIFRGSAGPVGDAPSAFLEPVLAGRNAP